MNFLPSFILDAPGQSFDREGRLFVPRMFGVKENMHWDIARENDVKQNRDLYVRLGEYPMVVAHVRFAVYQSYEALAYEFENHGIDVPSALARGTFPDRAQHQARIIEYKAMYNIA